VTPEPLILAYGPRQGARTAVGVAGHGANDRKGQPAGR